MALALITTGLIQVGAASFAAEDRAESAAELEAVTAAITDIENWLETAQANYSREEQELRDAEMRLSTINGEITALRHAQSDTRLAMARLEEERTTLETERALQASLLAQVLRAAYVAGEQSLLKLLLNQDDLNQSERMLHYYRRFSESRVAALETFRTTLDTLESVNSNLEHQSLALAEQQRALQVELAAREHTLSTRQQSLTALQASIQERGSELENLQVSQQQLQALIERIDQAIQRIPVNVDYTPFAERRGTLPRPVAGAVANAFGTRYGDGNLQRQGIDFASAPGAPVQAIHPGRVVFADWLRGAGLLIILDHGDGYMSLYGNNEALARAPGDWVNAGEVVATSGTGAGEAAAGLYFEIRHHGTPENPANWLATPSP